ncbi:MAG: PIN domain-containing protein [bacterium]
MKIIDTDIIIDYLNGNDEARLFIFSIPKKERCITVITMMELLFGCRNKEEIRKVKKEIQVNFGEVVQCSEEASSKAVKLIERYTKSHGLELADSLIAGIVIVKEGVLYTGNVKDFRYIEDLRIEGVTYKSSVVEEV